MCGRKEKIKETVFERRERRKKGMFEKQRRKEGVREGRSIWKEEERECVEGREGNV